VDVPSPAIDVERLVGLHRVVTRHHPQPATARHARSLTLDLAQHTTNWLRTIVGADLGRSSGLGKLDLAGINASQVAEAALVAALTSQLREKARSGIWSSLPFPPR